MARTSTMWSVEGRWMGSCGRSCVGVFPSRAAPAAVKDFRRVSSRQRSCPRKTDVSAVLRNSLQGDPTGSGKEQIAAALQAVAQDPLFVALLRETQARRDEAYTDKGAKKTAKGSVFKAAADRLNEARDEKERLQRIVADSEGAERQLRELTDRRTTEAGDIGRRDGTRRKTRAACFAGDMPVGRGGTGPARTRKRCCASRRSEPTWRPRSERCGTR